VDVSVLPGLRGSGRGSGETPPSGWLRVEPKGAEVPNMQQGLDENQTVYFEGESFDNCVVWNNRTVEHTSWSDRSLGATDIGTAEHPSTGDPWAVERRAGTVEWTAYRNLAALTLDGSCGIVGVPESGASDG